MTYKWLTSRFLRRFQNSANNTDSEIREPLDHPELYRMTLAELADLPMPTYTKGKLYRQGLESLAWGLYAVCNFRDRANSRNEISRREVSSHNASRDDFSACQMVSRGETVSSSGFPRRHSCNL